MLLGIGIFLCVHASEESTLSAAFDLSEMLVSKFGDFTTARCPDNKPLLY